MDYKLYHSGNLIGLRHEKDTCNRKLNGALKDPPAIWVAHYSYQHDKMIVEPISWEAAMALSPHAMAAISESMNFERSAEEVAREKSLRAAQGTQPIPVEPIPSGE